MTTQFKVLFNLELNHNFFTNGKLQGATITPTPTTRTVINQLGCVLRQTEVGYSVYYNTSNAHLLTEELLTDWEFYLQSSDPNFYTFTDLPKDSISFLFTDSAQDKILKLTEENDEQEPEAEVEQKPAPQSNSNGIILKFSPSIPTENSTPETHRLNFSARKTIWRYYIINNSGLSGTMEIQSEDATFKDLGTKEIQGTQAQLFQSDLPIALSQVPNVNFQLSIGDTTISLPNASPHQITPNKDQGFFSDIYVYI